MRVLLGYLVDYEIAQLTCKRSIARTLNDSKTAKCTYLITVMTEIGMSLQIIAKVMTAEITCQALMIMISLARRYICH